MTLYLIERKGRVYFGIILLPLIIIVIAVENLQKVSRDRGKLIMEISTKFNWRYCSIKTCRKNENNNTHDKLWENTNVLKHYILHVRAIQ